MLISLKVKNCFVFTDEVEFTMRADMRYKRFPNNVKSDHKTHVLKSAVLIGPNNAGKTNFVRCMKAIKRIMLNEPFQLKSNLFSDSSVCEMAISFLDDAEYIFEIKYDTRTGEFIYERFSRVVYDQYKNRKEQALLVRDSMQKEFFCEDEQLSAIMPVAARNNILIHLLDVTQFSALDKIKRLMISFASKIDVVDMNNIPLKKTVDMMKMPGARQQKIVNFIRNADLFLDDFRYASDDEVTIKLETASGDDLVPQENSLKETAPFMEMLHLTSFYKGIPVPSILFDSTGTKRWLPLRVM